MPPFNKLFRFPFYNFLFAAFPVLYIFQQNIREVLLGVVFKPVVIVFLAASFTFIIFKLMFKSWEKAGLFTALLIWLFFIHGRFHTTLGEGGLDLHWFKL